MGGIIWLASYPKSGNTWVRAFLHNLFRDPKSPFDINKMDALTGNEAALPNFTAADGRPWQEWTPDDVAAMRPAVQKRLSDRQQHMTFCKTHMSVLQVRGHPTINMSVTAGAVYIVRNPLDIVSSLADHQGLTTAKAIEMMNLTNYETPTTQTMAGEPWGSWSQNVESWTGHANSALHVMGYEDMLADPLKVFSGLVGFLRLDATPERIERAVENASFNVLRALEERDGFRERTMAQRRFFRSGKSGSWRDELTDDEARTVVAAHRQQMERFNYVPDGF
ncbi:MAG: sulfotransferase domain-containing protein [Pseudomonadota bacterium]